MADTNEEENKEIDLNDWTINSDDEQDATSNINKYANNYMELEFRSGTIRVVLKEPPSLSIDVKWEKSPATAMADMIKQYTCNDTFEMGAVLGGHISGNDVGYKHLVESGVYSSKSYNGIDYPKFSVSFRSYNDTTIFKGTSTPKEILETLKSTMALESNQVSLNAGIDNIGAAYDNTKNGVNKLVKFALNKNSNQNRDIHERNSMAGYIIAYLERISINGYKVDTHTDVSVTDFAVYVKYNDDEIKVGDVDDLDFTPNSKLDNYPAIKPLILNAIEKGKKDGYRHYHGDSDSMQQSMDKVISSQDELFNDSTLLTENGSKLLGGNVCKVKILPYGILGVDKSILCVIDDWSVEKSRVTFSNQSLYYDYNMSFSLCQIPNIERFKGYFIG